MGYVKAMDVLPREIVEQIQKYVSGEVIYIPKKAGKKPYGENILLPERG